MYVLIAGFIKQKRGLVRKFNERLKKVDVPCITSLIVVPEKKINVKIMVKG